MSGPVSAQAPRHSGDPFLRLVGFLSQCCGVIAALMIAVSVAITCQMIWVRFVLGGSTIWQTEAVTYLMIGATLIGLPYVQRMRGHVNVDLFPMVLRGAPRLALAIVIALASIAVMGLMLWYGAHMWHEAWSRGWASDTVWGIKLWIPYLAIPIGFGLFLLQLIADLYAVLRGIERPFGIAASPDQQTDGSGEAR